MNIIYNIELIGKIEGEKNRSYSLHIFFFNFSSLEWLVELGYNLTRLC